MGTLARATETAILAEKLTTVRAQLKFVDEVYGNATPDVKNAVHVSDLVILSFDERHGKRIRVRDLLSAQHKQAIRDLANYLEGNPSAF